MFAFAFLGFFFLWGVGLIFLVWSWTAISLFHVPHVVRWDRRLPFSRLLLGGWFLLQAVPFFLVRFTLLQELILVINFLCFLAMYLLSLRDGVALERRLQQETSFAQGGQVEKWRERIYRRLNGVVLGCTFFGPVGCMVLAGTFFQVKIPPWGILIGFGILLLYFLALNHAYNCLESVAS